MKITIINNNITFASIMKIALVGYFIGMGLFLLPFIILDIGNINELATQVMGVFLIPFILLVQAIFLGLLMNIGIFVYSKIRTIEVVCENKNL